MKQITFYNVGGTHPIRLSFKSKHGGFSEKQFCLQNVCLRFQPAALQKLNSRLLHQLGMPLISVLYRGGQIVQKPNLVFIKNTKNYLEMVARICSPSDFRGWGGRITWPWEVEAAVSCDGTTALQPEQPSEALPQNKNKTNQKDYYTNCCLNFHSGGLP